MKRSTKIMSAILACCTALSFAGCKSNSNTQGSLPDKTLGDQYPVQSDETLTCWMSLNPNLSSTYSNFGDTPYAKELEKETGIKVKYVHPTSAEQFNLMLASDELPDIIEYNWPVSYTGGAEKAINDGIIMDHKEIFEKYTPNLQQYLDSHKELADSMYTYSGKLAGFPSVEPDGESMVVNGPIVRKDWLDELGLEIPETVDDWHTMLTEFKNKKGATAPFAYTSTVGTFKSGFLSGAYNAPWDFFVEDGKIKYGPMEDGFEDFLKTFNQWYEEGLMDKNVMTADSKTVDANMLLGKTGAVFGAIGSGMGKWMTAGKQNDPNYELVAVPYPVLKKGDKPNFTSMSFGFGGMTASITTNCKNVELAAKLLDYGYTEKGHMLLNFGIEGESYEIKDGEPKYTDLIVNNSEGLSMANVLPQYARASIGGCMVTDKRYLEQYYQYPQQMEALKIWGDSNAKEHVLPVMIDVLPEDVEEASKIMTNVTTYRNEMCSKYMISAEKINFEEFRSQLKALNIDRVLELRQKAYDTYMNK